MTPPFSALNGAARPSVCPSLMKSRELAVLLLIAAALCCLLFLPPVVGLANQGDFERQMAPLGLDYLPGAPDKVWYYIHTRFVPGPPRPPDLAVPSSQWLLARAGLSLYRGFSKDPLFDIRFIGLANLLAWLAAVWLFLRLGRRLEPPARLALWIFAALVFTDAGYACYFNSFYSEPASLIWAVLLVALAADALCDDSRFLLRAAALLGASLLLLTAKGQNVVLAPALAAIFFLLPSARRPGPARLYAAGLALAVCAAAALYYSKLPPRLSRIALYNSIFDELLRHSPDARADLQALGLSPDLARFAGTHAYMPGVPYYFKEQFPDSLTMGTLVRFYLARPLRLAARLERGAAKMFSPNPPYLGNFPKDSGHPPRAKCSAFSFWTALRRLLPHSAVFVFLAAAVLPALLLIRGRTVPALAFLLLASLAALQMFVSIVADAEETDRHLFLFNVFFDLMLGCYLVAAVHWLGRLRPWVHLARLPAAAACFLLLCAPLAAQSPKALENELSVGRVVQALEFLYGKGSVHFEFSEADINAYLDYALSRSPRPAVASASVAIRPGNRVAVTFLADLEALRARLQPPAGLQGRKTARCEFTFQAAAGALTWTLQSFSLEGATVSREFFEKLIAAIAALQPERYDLSRPVPLPFGIRSLATRDKIVAGQR